MGSFETTPEKTIARFRDKPLDFQPGDKWNYSNSGYVLLGYVIEKTSGLSYAEFVQQNIFAPLGMKDSGYDSNRAIIERRASGYSPGKQGIENAGFVHMSVPYAAGGLYSTTEDLLRWQKGLFGGKLLKPESLAKMTTQVEKDYALGVGVTARDGHRRVSHGGGIQGFNTMLTTYPDEKITIAVLGNLNGPWADQIAANLENLAFGRSVQLLSERKEVKLTPEVLKTYAGVYELAPGLLMTVTLEGEQLMAQLTHQPKFPIYAESETKFFWKIVDAQVTFEKNTEGQFSSLMLSQNGRQIRGTRK